MAVTKVKSNIANASKQLRARTLRASCSQILEDVEVLTFHAHGDLSA